MTRDEYILSKISWDKSIEEYWKVMEERGMLDRAIERWDKRYSFYCKFQDCKGDWNNPKQEDFAFKAFDWIEYFIKDLDSFDISFPSENEVLYKWDGNELLIGEGMSFNGDSKIPNPAVLIDKLFKIYE